MSNPLGVPASIIAVLQLAKAAISYVKDVTHGSKDRTRMLDELRGLESLLNIIKDRVEDMESSGNGTDAALKPSSFASLAAPNGPVQRFKTVLEDLWPSLCQRARWAD